MNKDLLQQVKAKFKLKFGQEPLTIFSPGRINLIGEHTDYNEGFVFPAAINKGIYAALEKTNNNVSTVEALDAKELHQFTVNTVKPLNSNSWKNYVLGVVSEIQKTGKKVENFNLIFTGDIPMGAGLSSSAALENTVAYGLNKLFDLKLSKKELIHISQKAEHNFVGVKCGIMDQYANMFGVENAAILLDCRSLDATVHNIDFKDFEIVLINSNVKHQLAESEYNKRRAVCENIASLLKVNALRDVTKGMLNNIKKEISIEEYQKALFIIEENKRVLEASEAIKKGDYNALGELLYASHNGLQNKYKVSCNELDFLVALAKNNSDVLGARMMGGGFGGCTINIVKKEAVKKFIEIITNEYYTKFNIHPTSYQLQIGKGIRLVST